MAADSLERIANALERIADSLERAVPPIRIRTSEPPKPGNFIAGDDETLWETNKRRLEQEQEKNPPPE